MDDVSKLTKLGSQGTDYKFTTPSVGMLETFPNQNAHRNYGVSHECTEFSSLCPMTGQPDFAEIHIRFVPDELCVETKSLKLYLFAFRSHGAFMETLTNKIHDDLVAAMAPRSISVSSMFRSRGGIQTSVMVESHKETTK